MKTEYEITSRTFGPVQGAGHPWWTWCYRHPGLLQIIEQKNIEDLVKDRVSSEFKIFQDLMQTTDALNDDAIDFSNELFGDYDLDMYIIDEGNVLNQEPLRAEKSMLEHNNRRKGSTKAWMEWWK